MKVKDSDGNIVEVECKRCKNKNDFTYVQSVVEFYEVWNDQSDPEIPQGLPIKHEPLDTKVRDFEIACDGCGKLIDIENIDII